MRLTLEQAAQWLARAGVEVRIAGDAATRVSGLAIDTRQVAPGDLFVALRGERVDGHDYAGAAQAAGAGAMLVARLLPQAIAQLVVADPAQAMACLAAAWRASLAPALAVVAGSNGKTTTTQMLAAILARDPGMVDGQEAWCATRGNRNNELGLPLMLARLAPQHRRAVFEIGMNHPGEIARLAGWARPDVVVLTNAQREHQEFMESVEATAQENGAALQALGPEGTAVFPADDAGTAVWRQLAQGRRVLDFAVDAPAALSASVRPHAGGSQLRVRRKDGGADLELTIQLAGQHNARNALAAAAGALALGCTPAAIAAGLAAFTAVGGRGTRHRLGSATLIDESYNANPDSVAAAIALLGAEAAPRLLVLGDMGEVGVRGPQFHREAGELAQRSGIGTLYTVGAAAALAAEAFGAGARHHPDAAAVAAAVGQWLAACPAGSTPTVLVKGSRFMRLESVVERLGLADSRVTGAAGREGAHA